MKIKENRLIFYSLGSLSILLGFFLKENSAGGSMMDSEFFYPIIQNFVTSYKYGFEKFLNNQGSLIHSPFFYILSAFFTKLFSSFFLYQLFYLATNLSLPYIFYKILSEKFKNKSNYIFCLSLIIFFSPYFRSSAIWTLGDNLALIFFSLFIYYTILGKKNLNFKNYFLSLIFLVLSSYTRYYYAIYWVYFFYIINKDLIKKDVYLLLILSFIFSLPSLFYFYYILTQYEYLNIVSGYTNLNFFFSIAQILSIMFFYFIPFVFSDVQGLKIFLSKNLQFILLIIFSLFLSLLLIKINLIKFDDFFFLGGGVFIKLSKFLKVDNYFIFLSSIAFSIIAILFFLKNDKKKVNLSNYILLFCLFCSYPFNVIYQKYLDPLFFLIFFGLLESKQLINIISKKKISILITYLYFFSFWLFSLLYYLDKS